MKKEFIICILTAALMAACGLDPEPADPELREASLEVKEKYEPILTGEWYFDTTFSDKLIYKESLKLGADHSFTHSIKFMQRDLVTINGEETYTDWEIHNDSSAGSWRATAYRDDETKAIKKRLTLTNEYATGTVSIFLLTFTEANDTAIFLKNYYVPRLKRKQGDRP